MRRPAAELTDKQVRQGLSVITPEYLREVDLAAHRLLRTSEQGVVSGERLAVGLGVTAETYSTFFSACKELDRMGLLYFCFGDPPRVIRFGPSSYP